MDLDMVRMLLAEHRKAADHHFAYICMRAAPDPITTQGTGGVQ